MKVNIPEAGGICQSLQGRDKGRFYIIKEILPDGKALVIDGNFRRLSSPKKKNLRHLKLLPEKAEAIRAKLLEGKQIFDTEVFSALKPFNSTQQENEE